jgi:hypothetical protein
MRRFSPLSPTLFVAGGCGREQQSLLVVRHKAIFLDFVPFLGKAFGRESDASVRLGPDAPVDALVSFVFVALGR